MKAEVIACFRDKLSGERYRPGMTYDGSKARIEELAELGVVKAPKKKAKKVKK